MKRVNCFVVTTLLFVVNSLQAKIWYVPSYISTIKHAVEDSAKYGDTVLVAPGIYDTASGETFPINMENGVILMSEKGADSTIVDADSTNRIFNCNTLDSNTIISGFTIQWGYVTDSVGGGIYCYNSYLTITNNKILNNFVNGSISSNGGGICCLGGATKITFNVLSGNKGHLGSAIYCGHSNGAKIMYNQIVGNGGLFSVTPIGGGYGGGIYLDSNTGSIIFGNIIKNNSVWFDGGGIRCVSSSDTIKNNLICRNISQRAYAIDICRSNSFVINNTISNNTTWSSGSAPPTQVWLSQSPSPAVILNNIIVSCSGYGIDCYNCGQITPSLIAFNNVWGNSAGNFVFCPGVGDTTWGVNRNGIPCDSFYNISRPPMFAISGADSFFLSQIAAGQAVESPCVEAGDTLAEDLGFHLYTTRTDSVFDKKYVDMGYHYKTNEKMGIQEKVNITPPSTTLRVNKNPFSKSTVISFSVGNSRDCSLKLYDIAGKLVKSFPITQLPNSPMTTVTWDGTDNNSKDLKTGIYFVKLKTDNYRETKKLILMR
ncbi:MAG: T9SS type A sorting domain-containing protein [bacterium]|nr:T9SS type A sorting domain-containing protein [bacterium]